MQNMENDEYIFYGTALPEYEDENTVRKKAAKELQVRDEKGRQRFHGAFTGGFSAGYFNTVGTKEGWAPSSFISSRVKSANRFEQNPEDFMDEEDFGEFGIATRKIHTASEFQDLKDKGSCKRKFDNDAVIPGEAPLKDLVKPISESIGIKILKKLGWRPGQGIGPRIKKHSVKVYGCSKFPDEPFSEEDDPMMLSFTFAPKDTDEIFYAPKDNCFGLGYTGLSKKSILSCSIDASSATSTKSWLAKDKKKLSISGQAFGVGAFEDDDDDIYSKDDMSQYDFSELNFKGKKESNQKLKEKVSLENNVLEGFSLASTHATVKKHYPPPELPSNYNPISKLLLRKQSSEEKPIKSQHSLSSIERSFMLGEKKFQSFQFNTGKKVQKMQELQQESVLLPNKMVPNFRPFPNDSDKQQRYESYLNLKKFGEIEKLNQPSTMTEWEKQQEKEEFAKAAVLFKPLSAALSSRFESRSHLSVEHEVMEALEKIKEKKEEKTTSGKSLADSHNRKTVDWYPESLLCRRFNVPNPYPNSSSTGVSSFQKGTMLFEHIPVTNNEMDNIDSKLNCSVSNAAKRDFEIASGSEINSSSSVNLIKEKEKKDEISENNRPPMDLFKDIFGNSSSEDENSVLVEENTSVTTNTNELSETNTTKFAAREKQTNCDKDLNELKKAPPTTKVGFGIFANLDLDALNQRNVNNQEDVKNEVPISDILDTDSVSTKMEVDLYGPKLPPNYSSSYSNLPKTNYKKHTKHKMKHKHKHKHKSHKKKKKSSKKNSDGSDSTEDDDVSPNLIIEKLKEIRKKVL